MFLSGLTKTVLLVFSVGCIAQAGLTPVGVQTSIQYQPDLNNPVYTSRDIRSVWIQRNVTNERLALRSLAGLDSAYHGWEVVSVRANSRPNNSGRTVVQLVADGRIIATQINPGYQIYLIPQVRATLGTTIRTLQMVVNGSTYIDDIQIDLRNTQSQPPLQPPGHEPPPYPGNPGQPGQPPVYGEQRLVINVYRNLIGNDRVDLTQYIDLSRYRGQAIQEIRIQGRSSDYNSSTINLLVNGNNRGQTSFSGNYSQSQSMWLRPAPVIGRGADSVVLYSSGQLTVETVTLILSR